MKKSILSFNLLLIALFASSFSVFSQEVVPVKVGGAEISFDKETHDYGTMQQHANGECVFVFTNTGSEDLVISNAKGSCGCTVPSWPREPIAPGKTGELKVKYDTKRVNPIRKTITVTSNADTPTVALKIKGNVIDPSKTNVLKPTTKSVVEK